MPVTTERLRDASEEDIRGLADLLVDAVEDNAGISFMSGLRSAEAAGWWRSVFDAATARTIVLVARDETGIVGTVQLQPAWAPNQPHRGDIAKLIVHRRARGRGIARRLMRDIEDHAIAEGFRLLVLDTCRDGAAERLYGSLGWSRVGVIPRFALNPDGSPCDTVIFYREISA